MTLPPHWRREIAWLALVSVGAVAGGWLVGGVWAWMSLGLGLRLGWHLWQLRELERWLAGGLEGEPGAGGAWEPILERVRALQSNSRKRKRRLSRFLTRFREGVTALPDAVLILGREHHIEWANPAALGLLGVEWPADAGQPLGQVVRHPVLDEYLAGGVYTRPLDMPSPTNRAVVLSVSVTPFGKKYQHLLVARDITLVYHLDQTRQDFVANASHELRTPLTVMTGFIETLADDERACPGWRRSLELMSSHAARMQRIVEDLLTLSKVEMGSAPGAREVVPVAALLKGTVAEARDLSGPARHELLLDADRALGLVGDPEEFRSACSNLIFNAVVHSPPRTRVEVTWRTRGTGARLEVRDNGTGIPARHLPRLTERFYRVDKGRSRESGGTGLGLAIVKHILIRYGAELSIASEEGRGSTFACDFPREVLTTLETTAEPGVGWVP